MPSRSRIGWILVLPVACFAPLAARGWDEPAPKAAPADTPAPAPAPAPAVIKVRGEIPRPLAMTAEEFAQLPRQSVKAKDRDGKDAEFEGVPLHEVLQRAGLKLGQDLRGTALASYLLVEASDGYRVVFALPEIDPACTDRIILLADRRDGKPLAAHEGPLRIVVPGEKRHARWVRQVAILRIVRLS